MREHRRATGRRHSLAVLALLVAPGTAICQSPLDRTAGLEVVDEPLGVALLGLQQATGISLVFSPDRLPRGVRVSCHCLKVTVAEALELILNGTGLGFVSTGGLVTIVPARPTPDGRAEGAVLGRVVAAEDGSPIVNALVQLEGGPGTFSGQNGSFFFPEVSAGVHALRVTALGWREKLDTPVIVTAEDTTRMTIALTLDVIPLPAMIIQPGTFGLMENVTPGTARTLTREEIRRLPQLGEDVFRSVKQLPGVASGDISTRLTARGSSDREILVRLDGLELYEPYHVKDWAGALGIVDTNILGGVELQTGGFGPQFGDRMSGVFEMTSRRPEGAAKTTAGLSISNAILMSRGTFGTGKGAWLLSGRRGFLDLVMELANEGRRLSPKYHDVFGKVSYELGPSNRVTARFLLASDRFLLRDPEVADLDEVDFESEWVSRYGWVTWEAYPGTRLFSNTTGWIGTVGRNRDGFMAEATDTPFWVSASDHRDFGFFGLRSELSFQANDRITVKAGAEWKGLRAHYDYAHRTRSWHKTGENTRGVREDTLAVAQEPSGHVFSAYTALRLRLGAQWSTEFGFRYDAISHTGDRDLAPRLLAAYQISPRTNLRVSLGRYYQSHGLHELAVGEGETSYHPSECANQLAFGMDHRFPNEVGLRLELYSRTMNDQRPVYFSAEQEIKVFPEASGDRVRVDPEGGKAKGAEVLIERKSGTSWAWSASYALAIAEDRVDGVWVPRPFDQRHTVVAQTTFQPNRRWSLSLGWRYHTGWPASAWTWEVETLDDGWNLWTQEFGPLRGIRLPAYHRLDVRVTRAFHLRGATLQIFVDLFNVYNRTNLGSWDFSGSYEDGALTVQRLNGQEMLPFLPTFGFLYEF